MGQIYISAYCAGFERYSWLRQCIQSFQDFQVGIEFGTSWKTQGFRETLEQQVQVFSGVPATMHAPFVEVCTEPDSPEESAMEESFDWACRMYKRFSATSMVMHTHEKAVLPGTEEAMRSRVVEVICQWSERMKNRGVSLTVENVGYPKKGNVLFDVEQFQELFDRLPLEVGCLIDIGHAMLNGWDIPALIKQMGTRICGYHINTNDGISDLHLPIYDSRSCLEPKWMDEILFTIGQQTPDAHIVLEYAPTPEVTSELLEEDIRRVAALTSQSPTQS